MDVEIDELSVSNGVCMKTRSETDLMDVCENFELCELLKTRGEK